MRQRLETRAGVGTIYAELLSETDQRTQQYCAYEDMLKIAATSALEQSHVRDHITSLAKKIAGL